MSEWLVILTWITYVSAKVPSGKLMPWVVPMTGATRGFSGSTNTDANSAADAGSNGQLVPGPLSVPSTLSCASVYQSSLSAHLWRYAGKTAGLVRSDTSGISRWLGVRGAAREKGHDIRRGACTAERQGLLIGHRRMDRKQDFFLRQRRILCGVGTDRMLIG